MKHVLFALAMLAYSLVPAHADSLPKVFFGVWWCFEESEDGKTRYSVGSQWDTTDPEGRQQCENIKFNRNGYVTDASVCKFVSMKATEEKLSTKHTKSTGVYIIRSEARFTARCINEVVGEGEAYTETQELTHQQGTLSIKRLGR